MPMKRKKIAILFGGCSSEYEVSLKSASAVIEHLRDELYEPILIGITRKGEWLRYRGNPDKILADTWFLDENCTPAVVSPSRDVHGIIELYEDSTEKIWIDAALPILHGKNGEDGTIQGLLELAGIPIVGCDTRSSALCMDKELAHTIVRSAGILTPSSVVIRRETDLDQVEKWTKDLTYPLFVKPARAGSSVGITQVLQKPDLQEAVKLAFEHDDKIVVEETVPGFEVGCAIMGNEELIIGEVDEIELTHGFFDFTEKYTLKTAHIHMPARIDPDTSVRIKQTAAAIYQALGCSGFARVDLFVTPDRELVFNEVNTIPGFTPHSRFPNMLKGAGWSFADMLDHIIDLAVRK